MKKLGIIVGAIVVIIAVGFLFVKKTPQYSLYEFANAVQDHDADRAFLHFDTDAIVDNLVQDMMKKMEAEKKVSADPWQQAGDNMAKGLMTMMLPAMKQQMKSQMRTAITTPASADNSNKMINEISAGFTAFDIDRNGSMAIATLKTDRNVKLKMVKSGGHWKIVQIMMDEFLNQARLK